MSVAGIALDEKTKSPMVLLKDKERQRVLPIWVGPFEASAIIVEIEDVKPPRPLTHELLYIFIKRHGFTLKSVNIYEVVDSRHLARIIYKHGIKTYTLESRPSDAIALAVKAKVPIFCSEEILNQETVADTILRNIKNYPSDILFLGTENQRPPFM